MIAGILSEAMSYCKPDIVILEETYAGPNVKTTAGLNSAKGVAMVLTKNFTDKDPIIVNASKARSCLGLKDKETVFEHFRRIYKLPKDFKKYNDTTDAIALGYYYYYHIHDLCKPKNKKKKK